MPLSEDTKWVHSSSRDNKNPDRDLGGLASVFEISTYPMNNLFDNVTPDEAAAGLTDFRCFYILNKHGNESLRTLVLSAVSEASGGADVYLGTVERDDVQTLVITPLDGTDLPDAYGHVIFDVNLGPPLTVYWGTGIADFAANFQAEMNKLPMCENCTVTASGAWELVVTFTAEAGKRLVPLIMVVANRLDFTNGGNFKVFPGGTLVAQDCSGAEVGTTAVAYGATSTTLSLYPPVDPDSFPTTGTAWVYYKCLNGGIGGFAAKTYTNLENMVDRTVVTLDAPLGYRIEDLDPVYIDPKADDKFIVAVRKTTDGSPVGTTAEAIASDVTAPASVAFGSSIDIPWLLPQEGFYVWVKRTTAPLTAGQGDDGFELTLTGGVYT